MEYEYNETKAESSIAINKESVTARELNQLSKATSELVKQCEQLENTLGGVLRPQPKSVSEGTPEEELTTIPSEIRRQRKTVDTANYAIKSILSRLEI